MTGELAQPSGACLNCGQQLEGEFCHACGQSSKPTTRYFGTIFMELLDNFLNYDSRVYRTVFPLLFRPGYVCRRYLEGRRVSFLPPFRLYLFASVVFFLLGPMINDIGGSTDTDPENVPFVIGEQLEEALEEGLEEVRQDELANEAVQDAVKKIEELAGDEPRVITLQDGGEELVGLLEEEGIVKIGEGDESDSELERMLRKQFKKLKKENIGTLLKNVLNNLPTLMFFLIPILALILKILYFFSKRYYMEHLIVVLYSQSFLFFMVLIAVSLEKVVELSSAAWPDWPLIYAVMDVLVTVSYLWMFIYMFLFLKNVYQQGNGITFLKFGVLSASYFGLLVMSFVLAIVWGVYQI